jgi:hypothetical protein
MDGKVLSDIYTHPKKPTFIKSWDEVDGDFGELDKNKQRLVEKLIVKTTIRLVIPSSIK